MIFILVKKEKINILVDVESCFFSGHYSYCVILSKMYFKKEVSHKVISYS